MLPLRKLPWYAERCPAACMSRCCTDTTYALDYFPAFAIAVWYRTYSLYIHILYIHAACPGLSSMDIPRTPSNPGHGYRSIDQSPPPHRSLPTVVASYIHPFSPVQSSTAFSRPSLFPFPPQTVPLVTRVPMAVPKAGRYFSLFAHILSRGSLHASAGPGLGRGATAQKKRDAPG